MSLYPNPVNKSFYINVTNVLSTDLAVVIFNINGAIVYRQDYSRNGINVSTLSSGIFIVKIINTLNGAYYIHKLIKE